MTPTTMKTATKASKRAAEPAAAQAPAGPPVAVGLCRCSTDMQDHSVADQEAEIRAWVATQGMQLVAVFKDEGISGSELDRPGLNGLKAFLNSSEQKGTVVAWKRDRLVRPEDPLDGLLLEREIRQRGWQLHYLMGSNAIGNPLVDAIMGLVEHHAGGEYLRKLAQDSLRGQLRRVLAGAIPGGKIPYGFAKAVVDSNGKLVRTISRTQKHRKAKEEVTKLVPGDPIEIEAVKWIYTEYTTGRRGFAQIAKQLNERQVPPPNGDVWRMGSIRDLLRNRVYIGDLVWNKETSARFFRFSSGQLTTHKMHVSRITGKKTGYQQNSEQDVIVVPNNHPALVERALYERVQEVMASRAEVTSVTGEGLGGRWSERCYALTGLIFCTSCGHRMLAQSSTVKGHHYRRYLCSGYQQSRVCRPYWVLAEQLERAIFTRLKEHFRWGERTADELRPLLVKAIDEQLHGPDPGVDEDGLAKERVRLQRQVEQALSNLAVVPQDIAKQLGEKISGWQARVAEIDATLAKDKERRSSSSITAEQAADEALRLLGDLDRLLEPASNVGHDGAPTDAAGEGGEGEGAHATIDDVRAFFLQAVDRVELSFASEEPGNGRKRPRHRFTTGVIKTNAPLARASGAFASIFGSSGRTRTYNQVVNSHLLYH